MPPRIGDNGRRSEKNLAKRLGGRTTMGSGALRGDKGDIDLETFLVEAKATEKGRYPLDMNELAKISREARTKGKYPAFAVAFIDERARPLPFGSWVAVPEDLFKEMAEALAHARKR